MRGGRPALPMGPQGLMPGMPGPGPGGGENNGRTGQYL
jgi:hypothetical protein